jgi:hypothetical protein
VRNCTVNILKNDHDTFTVMLTQTVFNSVFYRFFQNKSQNLLNYLNSIILLHNQRRDLELQTLCFSFFYMLDKRFLVPLIIEL